MIPFDARRRQPPRSPTALGLRRPRALFTVGHTWVISSAMVNSFRVLGNNIYANKPGPQFFGPQDVGINAYTYVPGYIAADREQRVQLGSGSFTSNVYTKIQNYGASDDFTVVRGSHQIRVRRPLSVDEVGLGGQRVVGRLLTFTGQFTGNAMARLLRRPRRLPPSGQREPGEGDATGGRRLLSGLLETQSGYPELRRRMEPVPADELL